MTKRSIMEIRTFAATYNDVRGDRKCLGEALSIATEDDCEVRLNVGSIPDTLSPVAMVIFSFDKIEDLHRRLDRIIRDLDEAWKRWNDEHAPRAQTLDELLTIESKPISVERTRTR